MEGITRSKGREREVVDATERKVALLEKSFGTEGKSLRLRSTLLYYVFVGPKRDWSGDVVRKIWSACCLRCGLENCKCFW